MKQEQVCEINTNIDDMTGEDMRYLLEFMIDKGALDAWAVPVLTKGQSPAYRLSVQCKKADASRLCELLIKNSTAVSVTLEVRNRIALGQEVLYIQTTYGMVRLVRAGGSTRMMHEDLERLAKRHNTSIAEMKKQLLEEMER